MQPSSHLSRRIRLGLRLAAGGVLISGLMACGYKGPLYHPPPPEAPPASLTQPPGHDAPPGSSAN
ncbi:MAG TPA: lipoprotein [Burkholderiaceae bacterium]|jgi:predicted small lipoprotein YifL|nr:lipoprotein [Burkholderiaceae bacterium]